jgi:hypothetical protein
MFVDFLARRFVLICPESHQSFLRGGSSFRIRQSIAGPLSGNAAGFPPGRTSSGNVWRLCKSQGTEPGRKSFTTHVKPNIPIPKACPSHSSLPRLCRNRLFNGGIPLGKKPFPVIGYSLSVQSKTLTFSYLQSAWAKRRDQFIFGKKCCSSFPNVSAIRIFEMDAKSFVL